MLVQVVDRHHAGTSSGEYHSAFGRSDVRDPDWSMIEFRRVRRSQRRVLECPAAFHWGTRSRLARHWAGLPVPRRDDRIVPGALDHKLSVHHQVLRSSVGMLIRTQIGSLKDCQDGSVTGSPTGSQGPGLSMTKMKAVNIGRTRPNLRLGQVLSVQRHCAKLRAPARAVREPDVKHRLVAEDAPRRHELAPVHRQYSRDWTWPHDVHHR